MRKTFHNKSISASGLDSTNTHKGYISKYILGLNHDSKLNMTYDENPKSILSSFKELILPSEEINNGDYCLKCKNSKPPRTHHCRYCDRCILRMDHHCPWLGNCIGFENHKYYFLLLFYYSFYNFYTSINCYLADLNFVIFN